MIEKNSNILITGGAGGIGYELARTINDKVRSVGIIDNNSEKLNKINDSNSNFTLYDVDILVEYNQD